MLPNFDHRDDAEQVAARAGNAIGVDADISDRERDRRLFTLPARILDVAARLGGWSADDLAATPRGAKQCCAIAQRRVAKGAAGQSMLSVGAHKHGAWPQPLPHRIISLVAIHKRVGPMMRRLHDFAAEPHGLAGHEVGEVFKIAGEQEASADAAQASLDEEHDRGVVEHGVSEELGIHAHFCRLPGELFGSGRTWRRWEVGGDPVRRDLARRDCEPKVGKGIFDGRFFGGPGQQPSEWRWVLKEKAQRILAEQKALNQSTGGRQDRDGEVAVWTGPVGPFYRPGYLAVGAERLLQGVGLVEASSNTRREEPIMAAKCGETGTPITMDRKPPVALGIGEQSIDMVGIAVAEHGQVDCAGAEAIESLLDLPSAGQGTAV